MQVYEIPLDYLQKYENYFFQVADENQIVPGAQARVLFGKTQLPREQLGELWRICDLDEKGYLTKGEFIVAIHLMALCKKGIPLPPGLPDCLMIVARGQIPQPVQRFGSNQNIGIQPRLGSNSNIGIDPRFQSQNAVQAPKRFGSNSNISIQPIQAPQSIVHQQQQFDPNQIPGFQDTANAITAQRLQINESSQQLFGMQNQFKDLFASVLAEKQDELQQYQMINDKQEYIYQSLRTMITSLQDQYRTLSEELIKLQSQKTQLKMQNNTLQTTLHEQIQKNNLLTNQITQEIHQINQLPQAGNQFQQQQSNYLQNLTQSPNLQPQAQQQSYYSPNLQQPAQQQAPVPVYSPQSIPTVQLQPIQNQVPQQPQQISGFQQQQQQFQNFSPISQQKFQEPQTEWDNQKLQGILKAPGGMSISNLDYQQPKKQVTIQEYPQQEQFPW